MIIEVRKKDMWALCPHCNEWDELLWDEEKQLYVLICCRTYGIHGKIDKPKQKRKKIEGKTKPHSIPKQKRKKGRKKNALVN